MVFHVESFVNIKYKQTDLNSSVSSTATQEDDDESWFRFFEVSCGHAQGEVPTHKKREEQRTLMYPFLLFMKDISTVEMLLSYSTFNFMLEESQSSIFFSITFWGFRLSSPHFFLCSWSFSSFSILCCSGSAAKTRGRRLKGVQNRGWSFVVSGFTLTIVRQPRLMIKLFFL